MNTWLPANWIAKTIRSVSLPNLGRPRLHSYPGLETHSSVKRHSVEVSLDLLADQLECIVCLDPIFSPPVYQCCNGHIVCYHCKIILEGPKGKSPVCPTCSEVINGRNRILENIMINLKKECRWESRGCAEKFLLSELEHHERYCDSRPVQCPLIEIEPSCRFLGTGKEMAEHLHKRHADILIKEQGCNVTWKLRRLDDYMNQMAESYCLQEAFQRSFLLQIKTDLHRNFHFAVFLAGRLIDVKKFRFCLELGGREGLRLTMENFPFPMDRTMESMMSDGETLIVHPNLIKQFRDKKQQLPFQMRISNVLPNPYDSIPMPQRTESEETKEEAEHETEDDDDHTPRAQSPVPPEEERNGDDTQQHQSEGVEIEKFPTEPAYVATEAPPT